MTPEQIEALWEDLAGCDFDYEEMLGYIKEAQDGKYGDIKEIEGLEKLLDLIEGDINDIIDAQMELSHRIDEIGNIADEEKAVLNKQK